MAASWRSLPFLLHGVSAGAHLLLALAVAGRQLFARRGKDAAVTGSSIGAVGGFRGYEVAVRTTWTLAAFELLLAAYSCYTGAGAGWALDAVADQADAATRAVAWLLLAAYLQFEFRRRRRGERFPAPLRFWWALFLLLSVLSVAVHAATSLDGIAVPAHSWALDAVSVLAAGVLLVAGFLGKREASGSATEEPLLDDTAGENNAAYASAFAGAGFLSIITFSWMSPLISVGHKKTLGLDDVPDLDPGDSVAGLLPSFKANLEALASDGTTGPKVTAFKLAKVLVRTFRWHVAVTALYALVYNVATYVGPYLINSLVQYLNGGEERLTTKGQLLVLAFVAGKVVECLSQQHSCFRLQQVGIRARSALVAVVYEKGLALSCRSRQIHSSGEMINIVGVDADRIGNSSWYIHDLWLVPLQVGMALFVLYSNLGLASLAALGATVLVMLVNVPSGKVQEKLQQKLMGCKDVRMKATSEILRNMKILKLQGWEMKFLSKIIALRKTETDWLKKYLYTSTMVNFVFWSAPTFIAVVTFAAKPHARGEPEWLAALCSDRGKEAAAELVRVFVSTAVATYLNRPVAVRTCTSDQVLVANPKQEAMLKDLLVSMCNGAVETFVRTWRQVAKEASNSQAEVTVVREVRDPGHGCVMERVSSTLAVPNNRRLVLDVTGRVTAETVRSLLEFSTQRVSAGARKSIVIARNEVTERGLVAVKYLSTKSMAIYTLCLAMCMHISVGMRFMLPA